MFDVLSFADEELDGWGVAPLPPGQTRTERATVAATVELVNTADRARRRTLLAALFGSQLPALQAACAAQGTCPLNLTLEVPEGSLAPDMVAGFTKHLPSGRQVFVVLVVVEFKRTAKDNEHAAKKGGKGKWINQLESYRGDPDRWLSRQETWMLPAGGPDAVVWLVVCEFPRTAPTPPGWVVVPWAPLANEAVRDARDLAARGLPVRVEVGRLLREWSAPSGRRCYRTGTSRFASLRSAAVAAYNGDFRWLSHADRQTRLVVGPAGVWIVVDENRVEVTAGHPEYQQWAADVAGGGELLADDTCPNCQVRAEQCGHIDVDGYAWVYTTQQAA